jgi:hypothetical protein
LRPGAHPSLRSYDCHSQITKEAEATIAKGRAEAAACINRTDSRLLIIIGPCSIHSPSEALEYARRLKALSDTLPGLVVVMRAYLCVLGLLSRCLAVANLAASHPPCYRTARFVALQSALGAGSLRAGEVADSPPTLRPSAHTVEAPHDRRLEGSHQVRFDLASAHTQSSELTRFAFILAT